MVAARGPGRDSVHGPTLAGDLDSEVSNVELALGELEVSVRASAKLGNMSVDPLEDDAGVLGVMRPAASAPAIEKYEPSSMSARTFTSPPTRTVWSHSEFA